jgi:mannose-1-phosphate guanylyltransferase/mannose-6-phosphate isomerase
MPAMPVPCRWVWCIPLRAGWSDVGAWDALWQVLPKDDARQCGPGRCAVAGLRQHAGLVRRPPGGLCRGERPDGGGDGRRHSGVRTRTRRRTSRRLWTAESQKRAEGSIHRKVFRPWGWYDGVDAGERFQVKRIVVKPGGTLSCRCTTTVPSTGLWSAVPPRSPRARRVFWCQKTSPPFIPLGTTHRLENPGRVPLEMIEVQSGSYLGKTTLCVLRMFTGAEAKPSDTARTYFNFCSYQPIFILG